MVALTVTAAVSTTLSARNLHVEATAVSGTDAVGRPIVIAATPASSGSRQSLSRERVEQIRAAAQAQGTYITDPTEWQVPNRTAHPHAVLFFDLSADQTVDLAPLVGLPAPHPPSDGQSMQTCPEFSLVVVVRGGKVRLAEINDMSVAVYRIAAGTEAAAPLDLPASDDEADDRRDDLHTCLFANPSPLLSHGPVSEAPDL
jgi:hypothetical protein